MKLSKDKLRDRVDHWVSKFDPAGVRVPPVVDEGRYIEVSPGATAGTAFVSGHVRAEDGAALDQEPGRAWRPRCVNTIHAPTPSVALMRAGRWAGAKPS